MAVALLLGPGLVWGQVSDPRLTRLVRPTPGTRPLGVVLAELSRQSGVPFSYSSSLLPVGQPCHLRPGPARPLAVVLRELLGNEQLAYGLLAGQLVLWPAHVATPTGVTAVSSRVPTPAPPANSRSFSVPSSPLTTASATKSERVARQSNALSKAQALVAASQAKSARAVTPNPAYEARSILAATDGSTPRRPKAADISRRGEQPTRMGAVEKYRSPSNSSMPPSLLRRTRQHQTQAFTFAQPATLGSGRVGPSPTRLARGRGPTLLHVLPSGREVALLMPLQILPGSTPALPDEQPPVQVPVGLRAKPSTTAGPARPAEATGPKAPVALLRDPYLHGEAWGSESLPVGVAAKVGIPRIYLVLGAALGPSDHRADPQASWAWGVGLGTVGRPRGRFTTSLDLMQWFLVGDAEMDAGQGRLTQLRPTLAWQLKRGSRWQLVGGPTLNLATAHRDGQRTNWTLGQGQWLWLNSDNGDSNTRLWPGVQLGVRF